MKSLNKSGIRLLLPFFLSALMAGGATAQNPVPPARPAASRAVPPTIDLSNLSPFALSDRGPAFHIVPAAMMSLQDQELLATSQASLRRAASLQGVALDSGNWQHAQLACPSFPGHLLLRFERSKGSRDVSIVSVAIGRGNAGTLRVLPILRRSYAMFSPAPRNARTIAIFNRLLREEKTAAKPDWVSLAACYAAFSDQEPEIGASGPTWSLAPEPMLRLEPNGRASIQIVTLDPEARRWELLFGPNGALLTAKSSIEQPLRFHSIVTGQSHVGRAVPQAQNPR